MRHDNSEKLGKGIAKVLDGQKIFDNRDTISGKRKVRINATTWVYTSKTDKEVKEWYSRKFENRGI
ncbi:hypothetical protein [Parapedobacter indicus]|uniref:Uncharacterized protein n=1 Tax=Parapedobacter indicus TaxID=1477437 RepID=A0A1I3V281_9SPHI|nr:hypothetical protein [Parapedobacter indicus]PPK99019.1 hypothetical protein CLV26_11549 [Parapedobacter indicus]SFJ88476.1 hypothetical protein SAMN05444682_115128 [Parapedobacter indicus]